MSDVARRIIAVFLGFALVFFITTLGWYFPETSLYPFLLLMLSHVVAATVLGYMWPHIGWRIGLWMFVPWPLFVLVLFLLTGDYLLSPRANGKDILVVLLFCFSMLPLGCIGGWLGALMAGRYKKDGSPIKPPAG
jgi:hypothetical protein